MGNLHHEASAHGEGDSAAGHASRPCTQQVPSPTQLSPVPFPGHPVIHNVHNVNSFQNVKNVYISEDHKRAQGLACDSSILTEVGTMRPIPQSIYFKIIQIRVLWRRHQLQPSKRRGDVAQQADAGDGEARTRIAPFRMKRLGLEPSRGFQQCAFRSCRLERQLLMRNLHLSSPLVHAIPGEHKCIQFYYANITALSAQAKAFLATDYVNKFHLVGLAETHVVDRHLLKQFSKNLGRQFSKGQPPPPLVVIPVVAKRLCP